jgi:deoxyribonuclease-4
MIGIHIDSDINNLNKSTLEVKKVGGNCIQLFVSVMNKKHKEYDNFRLFLDKNNIKCIVHASYTINCSQNWNEHSWWTKQFIEEIKCANRIGAVGIVIHLGKQLELSKEEALNNMYSVLLYVHSETLSHQTPIFIETSTGQGSEICYQLEDLAHFYRKILSHKNNIIKNRFKLCIDTCHIFSAGYDIRNENTVEQYLDKFNELIGLEHVKLIHLNDSKNDIGSKLDRHENIGDGYIGESSLLYFAKKFIDLGAPIILETPGENIFNDLQKLKTIVKI